MNPVSCSWTDGDREGEKRQEKRMAMSSIACKHTMHTIFALYSMDTAYIQFFCIHRQIHEMSYYICNNVQY